jgi:DNA-binding CsgD family transcriptional regulator
METYVLNACRQIRAARSNRELRGLLDSLLCGQLGWDNYGFVAQMPTKFALAHGLVITNYPLRWILHYLHKGYYRVDPLANHCMNHNVGMVWTSNAKDWTNFSKEVQEIVAMVRKEGWAGGVAIPVPAVPCRGSFALLTRKPLDSVKEMVDTALLLGPVIGLHIHDALLEITLNRTFSVLDRKNLYLTDLEKDILQWTADGMPGKQVADQLGISVKAVERHLERVRERLKAPNRAKMLVMGVALGLIQTGRAFGSIVNAEGFEDRLGKIVSGEIKVPPHLVNDYLYDELSDEDKTP